MNQLSLIDWQPPPELMVAACPPQLHDLRAPPPATPVVSSPAIAWQEGNIAYYRKLMVQFMDLQRLDAAASTATPQKQAMRKHMISDLQARCVACLAKIQQLQGGKNANT